MGMGYVQVWILKESDFYYYPHSDGEHKRGSATVNGIRRKYRSERLRRSGIHQWRQERGAFSLNYSMQVRILKGSDFFTATPSGGEHKKVFHSQ